MASKTQRIEKLDPNQSVMMPAENKNREMVKTIMQKKKCNYKVKIMLRSGLIGILSIFTTHQL